MSMQGNREPMSMSVSVSASDSPILHMEDSYNPNILSQQFQMPSKQVQENSPLENQNQSGFNENYKNNQGSSNYENQENHENQGVIIFKNIKSEPAKKAQNPYPWMSEKTKSVQNPMIRMHNEMIDFFLKYEQKEEVHKQNLNYFTQLQGIFFKFFSTCEIMAPFLISKVYLTGTQIQIFVILQTNPTQQDQNKVRKCLQDSKMEGIKYYSQAPPTSAKHKQHIQQFTCHKNDKLFIIKVVSSEWFQYLKMLHDLLQNGLEAKYVYMILQTMIRQRGFQSSIRSYLILGLVAVFFHQRRRQKARSLTQNMIKFIQYYGVGPFQERKIIFMSKNDFEIRQQGQLTPFSFWISQKVQISTPMLKQFFNILKNRYRLFSNHNFVNDVSILSILINPCGQQFRY